VNKWEDCQDGRLRTERRGGCGIVEQLKGATLHMNRTRDVQGRHRVKSRGLASAHGHGLAHAGDMRDHCASD
jgi:hypothetical protein